MGTALPRGTGRGGSRVRDVRFEERPQAQQRQLDMPRLRGRDGRMTRCPGCGRSADAAGPAYLVVCEDCAAGMPSRDLPLRGLPQSTSCGGLCGGTGLVWEDVPLGDGVTAQRLVPCPDCAQGQEQGQGQDQGPD